MSEKPRLFDRDSFARSLRVRAAHLGLTHTEVADKVGVSKATMSRTCSPHGNGVPDVETYLRLTAWLAETEKVEEA